MKNLSIKPTMFALFTASVLFLASCSKTGPEGPEGIQGNAGQQGPQGNPGAKGDKGTANVIYSAWTTFNNANWQPAVDEYGKLIRHYLIIAPPINSDVLNNGVVLIYMRAASIGIGPTLLPQTFYSFTQGGINQYIGFNIYAGQIKIKFFNIDNTNDPGTFGGFIDYRYIVIPGGVTTTSASINDQSSQLDYKDYNAVKAYYNLPE